MVLGEVSVTAWNVNGIQRILKLGTLQKYIDEYDPDVL